MRRQGLVWLAAAVLALGAAACFSDPTKSLRNGATRLSLAQNTLLLHSGDSASVQGLVYDDQGNELTMTGATWSSTDATIASVRPDTANPIPGDAYTRGVIKGTTTGGGVTTVVLTLGALTDTVRVTVLPAVFPGATTITGTAGADTIPASPSSPAVVYNAGDTLTLSSTALVTFSAATSTVSFGPDAGYIISRSANQIKVMARRGFQGAATITNLTFAGNAQTGPIAIASIPTSSVNIQRARFRGTAVATANALLGAGSNTIVVTAPGNMTFDSLSGATLDAAGSFAALTLDNLTVHGGASMTLSTRAAADSAHANVLFTNVLIGGARVDSVRFAAATVLGPVARATLFPGTISILGGGNLLDTIVVKGNGVGNFTAASAVTVNGVTAFIVSQTLDSLRAVAKLSGAGTPTVSFRLGQTAVANLAAQGGALTVNAATGETNEPANDVGGTAPTINIAGSTAASPAQLFGAINSSVTDSVDYYKITTVAGNLTVGLAFTGTGAGTANNPKLDLRVCTDVACATPIVAPTNATAVNPATGTSTGTIQPKTITATALAAGTYYIKVTGANTNAATYSYRLRVNQ